MWIRHLLSAPVETTVPVWAKVGVAGRSLSHQKNWREHFSWPPFTTNAMRIVDYCKIHLSNSKLLIKSIVNGWQPCYFIYSAKPFSFNVLYFPLWKLCSAMFYWVAIEPDFPPVLVFCRLAVFLWQGNGDRLHLSVSFQTIFTQLTTLYFDSKSILSKCFGTKMIYFLYLAGHLISSKRNLKKHHHQLLLQLFMI